MSKKYEVRVDRTGRLRVSVRAYTHAELVDELWHCYAVAQRSYETPCWEWTKDRWHGYGRFQNGGEKFSAHRFAWEITYGPVPEGLFVCHKCDNPPCIRPDHLFLGTNGDNQDDSVMKSRHWRSRFTPEEVAEIRRLVKSGEATQAALTARFGVRRGTISKVVNGKRWKRVVDQAQ